MGIYIFPIFLFGCVITGIVLLGVQQARTWAKDEAAKLKLPGSGGTSTPAPPVATNQSKPAS